MAKYESLDQSLLDWVYQTQSSFTVSQVVEALGVTEISLKRHVSKRITQLQTRGYISCQMDGCKRICKVEKERPETLSRKGWRSKPIEVKKAKDAALPALNSEDFIKAGGVVERLPSHWDKKPSINTVGVVDFAHYLAQLD